MTTPATGLEQTFTIWFNRGGENPVDGWLRIRGGRVDDFELTSPVLRIPQDACDAVKLAIARLEEGKSPASYFQALDAIQSMGGSQVTTWPLD